ncbi:MAG: hypothetical protein ABW039_08510 [Sphingobium sp.]
MSEPTWQLTDADEGLHPHGPEENWQESCVLAWQDLDSGMGGNHRISVQANRGVSNLWCAVFHDRDEVYRLNLENIPFAPMTGENVHGFQCSNQRMFHDGKDLRVQLDEPECKLDLVVHDFKDSVEAFMDGGQLSQAIYRSHFNMHCRVTGTSELNGVKREIKNGLGWRDHSWGPRDWSTNLGHRSFHGNFGPDLNFHMLVVLSSSGKLDRRGHFVRNGKVHTTSNFTTRIEILEDGITPVRGRCHIFLEDGEQLTFHCEVQKGVFATVEMFQAFFGNGECFIVNPDGTMTGGGFCNFEVTNNPRLGTNPLIIALGNRLENGYEKISIEPWKYEPL